MEKYAAAHVRVNGKDYPVEIPELVAAAEAAEALEVTAPVVPPRREPAPVAAVVPPKREPPAVAPAVESRAEVNRPRRSGGRAAGWVVDAVLAVAGGAAVVAGSGMEADLRRDLEDGTVEQEDRAQARAQSVNLVSGLGVGGLVGAAGLGITLIYVHPTSGGAAFGVVVPF